MAKTLQDLIAYLDAQEEPANLNALTAELDELEVDWPELEPHVLFSAGGYRRNLVKAGKHYHLLVLCWRSGQRSPIHDHTGSSCALRVLAGTMTETLFEFAAEWAREADLFGEVPAGAVAGSVDKDIHQVSNLQSDDADLITLHVYSPPLLVMGTYSPDDCERGEEAMFLAFTNAAGI